MTRIGKATSDGLSRAAEKRLIGRAKRGEQAALRELIDGHKDRLFAFVMRTIRNHHDAEEVCQDALLKAFRSLDSFDTKYRFSTWLFTIGYRLCLNLIRRRKDLTGDVEFTAMVASGGAADTAAAQSEEARHLMDVVWSAVDRLSTAQRATVVLFYRHELGCAEISEVLEVPVATVKSHLHRARARLREILEPVVAEDFSRLRILTELAG